MEGKAAVITIEEMAEEGIIQEIIKEGNIYK